MQLNGLIARVQEMEGQKYVDAGEEKIFKFDRCIPPDAKLEQLLEHHLDWRKWPDKCPNCEMPM